MARSSECTELASILKILLILSNAVLLPCEARPAQDRLQLGAQDGPPIHPNPQYLSANVQRRGP
jgi:hypothetical protein